MITLLEGNQLVSLNPIDHKGNVFEKGSIFTIDKVFVDDKTYSIICFSVEEIQEIAFGQEIDIFSDRFSLHEEVIEGWFNDDEIR
jgi:hypothetical protein